MSFNEDLAWTREQEDERLEALFRYALLDTPREDVFEDLSRMGARYFGVPQTVITLVDRDRIWFKSTVGVEASEVGRDPGLCMEALRSKGVFHLRDARLDPVACGHPLVAPSNGVRFYAGHPLVTRDGHPIGTFCVFGPEPREFSDVDRETLESLARLTMNEIERRYAQDRLEELNRELDTRVRARTFELDSVIEELLHEAQERGTALEALRISEDRQRRIAELGSDFCFEVELVPQSPPRLLWVTGPIYENMGYDVDDLNLLEWSQYIHPDDQPMLRLLFDDTARKGTGEAEYRFRCQDGSYRWIRLLISTMPGSNEDEGATFLAAIKDLHRERSAEDLAESRSRDLEQSRNQLRAAHKLAWLGTVAAGMAHQVNNPVGSILAATEFAQRCEGDSDERDIWKKALADIAREANRCGQIVRGILQFGRHDSTPKSIENLTEVVDAACGLAQSYASDSHARIDLRSVARSIPVELSRFEIEEVLVNILRNAVEAGPTQPIQVLVEIQAESARIEIRDDGHGISSELSHSVFEPFFTTRLEEGGTGLGLSVAHGIVEDHSGDIVLESDPEKGTTVTILLPLARRPSRQLSAEPSSSGSRSKSG